MGRRNLFPLCSSEPAKGGRGFRVGLRLAWWCRFVSWSRDSISVYNGQLCVLAILTDIECLPYEESFGMKACVNGGLAQAWDVGTGRIMENPVN